MEKKSIAKWYLASIFGLYIFGVLLLFGITFSLVKSGRANPEFGINWILMISLLCPLIPCGSYAGFCTSMMHIKEFGRVQITAICVLFPITLAIITVFGMIMIIPSIIKEITVLLKKEK